MQIIPAESAPEAGSAACLKNWVTSCKLCAPSGVIWLSFDKDNGGRFRTTSDAVHSTSLQRTGLPAYNKTKTYMWFKFQLSFDSWDDKLIE